jgi:hypothetical protein
MMALAPGIMNRISVMNNGIGINNINPSDGDTSPHFPTSPP